MSRLYKHVKTGGVYADEGRVVIEATKIEAVLYRNVESDTRWVRPVAEFFDGRFVLVEGTSSSPIEAALREVLGVDDRGFPNAALTPGLRAKCHAALRSANEVRNDSGGSTVSDIDRADSGSAGKGGKPSAASRARHRSP